MRRPQALDRRLAAGIGAAAALGLLITAGLASYPARLPTPDPAAARDLVGLLRAGEGRNRLATYDFTRTLANGRQLRATMREGRAARLHVLISGTAMSIDSPTRTYDCTLVGAQSACRETSAARTLPESEVLRVAVAAGAYGVTRLPATTIAGEPASCFRVLATGHGGLPALGVETDECLAADGISLRDRVVHTTGDVDERTATQVRRRVSAGEVEALAQGFDPEAGRPRR